MIRLSRGVAPRELDATTVSELTDEFKRNDTDVWNKKYIRSGLLLSSHDKCAYCENNISEESKYMEVEHFRCKSVYPDLVVEWGNLLPSCKRCNTTKSKYDVEAEGMIVDPFSDEPSQHLYFHNYRLRYKSDLGRRSVEVLNLNDTDRMVIVRVQIGEKIAQSLEVIKELIESYIAGENTTRRRNRIVRGIENLLIEASSSKAYSALTATVLLCDPNYEWIKNNLKSLNLWGTLESLEREAQVISLAP